MATGAEWNMYAPNLVCIGIDRSRKGEYTGRLWHQYQDDPICFSGTMELIDMMDTLYDEWDFPQRSMDPRSFVKKNDNMRKPCKKGAALQMDAKRISNKSGEMGTFIVRVKYRQHSTWQGEVVWAEGKQKNYFRSALELMKMIDEVLDQNEQDAEPQPDIEETSSKAG